MASIPKDVTLVLMTAFITIPWTAHSALPDDFRLHLELRPVRNPTKIDRLLHQNSRRIIAQRRRLWTAAPKTTGKVSLPNQKNLDYGRRTVDSDHKQTKSLSSTKRSNESTANQKDALSIHQAKSRTKGTSEQAVEKPENKRNKFRPRTGNLRKLLRRNRVRDKKELDQKLQNKIRRQQRTHPSPRRIPSQHRTNTRGGAHKGSHRR